MWYFWWGGRGNLTLITLRSERKIRPSGAECNHTGLAVLIGVTGLTPTICHRFADSRVSCPGLFRTAGNTHLVSVGLKCNLITYFRFPDEIITISGQRKEQNTPHHHATHYESPSNRSWDPNHCVFPLNIYFASCYGTDWRKYLTWKKTSELLGLVFATFPHFSLPL